MDIHDHGTDFDCTVINLHVCFELKPAAAEKQSAV